MKNIIVFAQEHGVGVAQGGTETHQSLSYQASRELLEKDAGDPPRRQLLDLTPVARKSALQQHADHAVVVVLHRAFDLFPSIQDQRAQGLRDGWALEAHVL